MSQLTMTISGMTCGHCVGSVKRALAQVEGVQVEQVTLGTATVNYDDGKASPTQITAAVEDQGYRVLATD